MQPKGTETVRVFNIIFQCEYKEHSYVFLYTIVIVMFQFAGTIYFVLYCYGLVASHAYYVQSLQPGVDTHPWMHKGAVIALLDLYPVW